MMSRDLKFAVDFARHGGQHMRSMRVGVGVRRKLNQTEVTDADDKINRDFIEAVEEYSGGKAAVQGEEASRRRARATDVWIIDPIDATGEYVDPSIPESKRTSCVGIALLRRGVLMLSVVLNPFRGELLTAERGGRSMLNGRPIRCSTRRAVRGAPYDYVDWKGARFNLPRLEQTFGRPLGVYSAIYQACMVATGQSTFAAFPGDTIHDIAPGARLAIGSGALVTDFRGRPLDWNDLRHGVLYSNPASHAAALRVLRSL